MNNEYIIVKKTNGLVTGGYVDYVEVWNVPSDFTKEEILIYENICREDIVTPETAINYVRKLREQEL
jgi:hypothetical protein